MLSQMQFSGNWRDYQARVLDELDGHLGDGQIHVVAAPGSGKTVLGLEIMRRMQRPALILSPTITIRDQWLARLVPLFLSAAPDARQVSCQLDAAAPFTTSTYQALHALWAGQRSETGHARRFAALIAELRALGPLTLVLDEAHHLRREWWNALLALKEALPDARLVSLTATPPYDAPQSEWARYEALCGPIDLEISVPELVRNGDLCPHQDHIVFSAPDADTLALLDGRRRAIGGLLEQLRGDAALVEILGSHPWLTAPEDHTEAILETPELLSAILVFLASCGQPLPRAPLRLLGVSAREVPAPSAFWTEILLNGLLDTRAASSPLGSERIKRLRSVLAGQGLIEGGRVKLGQSRAILRLMAGSLGKLDSIAEIARREAASLGPQLRMVVLSDHIRDGDLPRIAVPDYCPAKLGVIPIFARLRTRLPGGQQLGVLTGKLAIVPARALPALHRLSAARAIAGLTASPLAADPLYLRVSLPGMEAHRLVELFTALFTAGEITVLIGTQALLGEGWDAPAINSLVLASNSATFMLSNQMRGRALRIDPAQPAKVSNIWHLATVVQPADAPLARLAERLDWGQLAGEHDEADSEVALLGRRFRCFEGIANGPSPLIESGLARLGLADAANLTEANARTYQLAGDRAAIANRWTVSLGTAPPRAQVRETASPTYAPRGLAWRDTLRWLGVSAAGSAALAMANALGRDQGWTPPTLITTGVIGAGALAALPKLAKASWLAWRNGSLEGSLRAVGEVLLDSLYSAGAINAADHAGGELEVRRRLDGTLDLILRGTSRSAERALMLAIGELLGPVQNPRFLLVRSSWLGRHRRTDWHAVPTALARSKASRETFLKAWQDKIGSSTIIATRTPAGRRMVLRARAQSFAAGFQRRVARRSVWV